MDWLITHNIDTEVPGAQYLYSMAYRPDGTLFAAWQNDDGVMIGRFCESGRDFDCEALWNDLDTWVNESAFELNTGASSGVMTLDPSGPNGGTPAIGVTTDKGLIFTRCIPGISRICTPDAGQ